MAIIYDHSCIPLSALSSETIHLISTLINPPKVIPSSSGLMRDWRGVAQVYTIRGEILPSISSDPDPFGRILSIVRNRSQSLPFEYLNNAFKKIERWDIVDDLQPYLENDTKTYLERLEKSHTKAQETDFTTDAEILTIDDQFRIERGEDRQHYDAFILYADEDQDFVNELVENLEKKNNLKLCLKERDLIAGITFEHEAVMRLISERCNRLIIVITPDFFKSAANKFFLNFAQATGIDRRQERKIIPCIYKNCELPPQLMYFSKIYYKKLASEHFWNKLILSMKVVPSITNTQKSLKGANETKLSRTKKTDDLIRNDSVNKEKIKENLSEEPSKFVESLKILPSFPWKRKEKTGSDKGSDDGNKHTAQESISNLSSLHELDSRPSLTTSTNSPEKNKKKNNLIKRVQSLLAKGDT